MPHEAFAVAQELINGTTGTGLGLAVNHCEQISGFIKWATGVSAGKIVVEIAPSPEYTGAWSEIAASDVVADSITAPAAIAFTWPAPAGAVRAGFTSDAVGGNGSVLINGITGY